MSWKRTGFLCEYDSKNVSSFKETNVDEKFHNLVAFRVDGESVLANTVATMANDEDLEKKEEFEKFRGKVWSQYLGFLRNPKNLFAENMKRGELGWVTVKYAPVEDTVFEIQDVAENCLVQLPAEQLLPTPWSSNFATIERPQRRSHPSQRVFDNKFSPLNRLFTFVRYGICVQTDVLNPFYVRGKQGSMRQCHHLFSVTLGMYRCMHIVELGCWYQHEVRDTRRDNKKKFGRRNDAQFDSITAVKLFKIDAPLPTTVVNGRVEFEVEFPFDHDVLEKESNRGIPDWLPRFEGLQKDAHFWNEYLGKVEIYPRQARDIIQKVEAWPLETIPGAFTVVATVSLHYNAATNNETYPENGIFLVTNVKEKVEAWPLETIPRAFTVVATVALHYNVANIHETYPRNGIFLVTNVKEVKGIN